MGIEMGTGAIRVEKDGWFIDIEVLDVSRRPSWEIRCAIRRMKDGIEERRNHRFYVEDSLADALQLETMPTERREERLLRAAKGVVLRELGEIFAEPEEGLDSLRPLSKADLGL